MRKSLIVLALTSLSMIGCTHKPAPRQEISNLPSLGYGYSRLYFSAGEMGGIKLRNVDQIGPVFLDGKQVSSIAKDEHSVVDIKPGAHELYCTPEKPEKNYIEKMTTTLREGETRYLACDMNLTSAVNYGLIGIMASDFISKTFFVERALDPDSRLVDYKRVE